MEYEMGDQFADDGLDKSRRKSAIRKKAIKFTKIISLVGLRHATDSRNSVGRRFVWLLWVVFGIVLAVYQIQDRIGFYLEYPAKTEVKFITDELSLLFPQVTICEDKAVPYTSTLTGKIDDELKRMKEAESKPGQQGRDEAVLNLKTFLDQLHNETHNWEELSKNKSLSADKAILEASFNSHLNESEDVITDAGHCFAFSTEQSPLHATKGGAPHGLHVKLKASTKEGFKIFIHDSLVFPNVKHDGITLRQGTLTRVVVSFEYVTYLGSPYDNCYSNATDPNYRLVNCLKKCDYAVFTMQCGCRDIHMGGDAKVCSYANILNYTKLFGKQENGSSADVNCTCGPECRSRNYKTSITQTSFPHYGETVDLYVYYQHLTYMRLKNVEEFTFLELLCDIGGALSLLLGATLLTVYEAVEFFLLFIKDYLRLRFAK